MIKKIVLGIILVAAVVFGILYFGNFKIKPKFLTYQDPTFNFEIQYPADWEKQVIGQNPIFFSPLQDGSEFRENVNVTVEDLSKTRPTLEQYKEANSNFIKIFFDNFNLNFNLVETTPTKLGGSPAYKVIYTVTQQDNAVKQLQIYSIYNNRGYILTYTATPETYAKYLSLVEIMADSFAVNFQ